jgi:tripartite-type tricarboxylate transporter receptor subunit TctC
MISPLPLWSRAKFTALTALCLIALTGGRAIAEFPEKPIRLLLPFPAGGTVDIVARLVAGKMADDLGRPIVIENKAGAGGIIATDATAKAAPDGYTLLLTTPNHTINAALQPKLPYDTEKDLVPVSIVAEVPELLVSHSGAPFADFAGFVDYAKRSPGKLNYSSAGNGTLPHITMELLLRRLGIEVRSHPLSRRSPCHDRSAQRPGPAQDGYLYDRLAARHRRQAQGARLCEPHSFTADAERADRHRTWSRRIEGILWIGMMAPAGTPQPVIDKLATTAMRAVRTPEVAERLRRDGVDPVGSTPADFAALIAREIAQWRDVIAAAKITVE